MNTPRNTEWGRGTEEEKEKEIKKHIEEKFCEKVVT